MSGARYSPMTSCRAEGWSTCRGANASRGQAVSAARIHFPGENHE